MNQSPVPPLPTGPINLETVLEAILFRDKAPQSFHDFRDTDMPAKRCEELSVSGARLREGS